MMVVVVAAEEQVVEKVEGSQERGDLDWGLRGAERVGMMGGRLGVRMEESFEY